MGGIHAHWYMPHMPAPLLPVILMRMKPDSPHPVPQLFFTSQYHWPVVVSWSMPTSSMAWLTAVVQVV